MLNVFDFKKDLLTSIEAPRVHHQLLPNNVGEVISSLAFNYLQLISLFGLRVIVKLINMYC